MVEQVVILPGAEHDIDEAYDWYEQRHPGLGNGFLRCVDACIFSIQRNPELHAFAFENYRRALVRRFPYAVFYEYSQQTETVVIYSVFHCSQDPSKWRRRLP